VDVELRFTAAAARRVRETQWYPSQSLRALPDGSIVMRLRVASTTEILLWVLGWGSACEVVAPHEFRQQVEADVAAMTGALPRAIVCANDQTAAGVMHALARRGIAVPGEVAVTGFDDVSVPRHLHPPLTTVRQPIRELGATRLRRPLL